MKIIFVLYNFSSQLDNQLLKTTLRLCTLKVSFQEPLIKTKLKLTWYKFDYLSKKSVRDVDSVIFFSLTI